MSPTRIMILGAIIASACGFDSHAEGSQAQLRCSAASECPGSSQCVAQICRCQLQSECGAGFECEHAGCARHRGDDDDAGVAGAAAVSCQQDTDCGAGWECEHGSCQLHENDHQGPRRGNASLSGGAAGNAGSSAPMIGCTTDAECTGGLECESGSCQLHDRGNDDAGADDDHGRDDNRGRDGGQGDDNRGPGNGADRADAGNPGVSGQVCRYDSECLVNFRCEDGVCAKHGGPGRH